MTDVRECHSLRTSFDQQNTQMSSRNFGFWLAVGAIRFVLDAGAGVWWFRSIQFLIFYSLAVTQTHVIRLDVTLSSDLKIGQRDQYGYGRLSINWKIHGLAHESIAVKHPGRNDSLSAEDESLQKPAPLVVVTSFGVCWLSL